MSRNVRVLVCALLMGMPAVAQEALPTLPEVMAEVQDTELYLQGYIGRGPEGAVRFVLPDMKDTGFPVDFKSDTDMDKAIEGCGFDGSGGLPCKMVGYGYLNWEQSRLRLVLTRIETIDAPTAKE